MHSAGKPAVTANNDLEAIYRSLEGAEPTANDNRPEHFIVYPSSRWWTPVMKGYVAGLATGALLVILWILLR
jgi:hypothetical protein